jgi:hypothetical protein
LVQTQQEFPPNQPKKAKKKKSKVTNETPHFQPLFCCTCLLLLAAFFAKLWLLIHSAADTAAAEGKSHERQALFTFPIFGVVLL